MYFHNVKHSGFNLFLAFFFLTSVSFSQHIPSTERGDPKLRVKTQLDANQIRTTVFNFGQAGRSASVPIYEETPFEWPKNSGQVYMALTGLMVGGEVEDANGNMQKIVDVFNYRTSPEGKSWNFEPLPGYFNTELNTIANSLNPDTWPDFWPDRLNYVNDPGWPGKWDGYLGKDQFIEGQELYYKISDDLYDNYQYNPDSTDLSRKGLGLIVSCRSMEFTEYLFEDIAFFVYEIKNDGTEILDKMGVTLCTADFVGGDGDSQDDLVDYDLDENFVWFYDKDGHAPTFGDNPVGACGVAFLKSPDNFDGSGELGITNLSRVPAGGLNINSDVKMWHDFMIPGKFFNPLLVTVGEYDTFISSSYFSLEPGESTELIVAVVMGNGPDNEAKINDIYQKLDYAQLLYQYEFRMDKISVVINYPQQGDIITEETDISWTVEGDSGYVYNYIYYSANNGSDWIMLGIDSANTGCYTLTPSGLEDGIFYKIRILSIAENGIYIAESQAAFTINNPEQNVSPEIMIFSPQQDEQIDSGCDLSWMAGDADGDSFLVDFSYRLNTDLEWITLVGNFTELVHYEWDTRQYGNSEKYQLRGRIIAGSDTTISLISGLSIINDRLIYPDSTLNLIKNCVGTGDLEIHVVDTNEVKGDDYLLVFKELSETSKIVYDVINQTTGQELISNAAEIDGKTEGPYFDGLRLVIHNDVPSLIEESSGWNFTHILPYSFKVYNYAGITGEKRAADYLFVVDEVGADTSTASYIDGTYFEALPVNVIIFNCTENKQVDFVFIENDTSGGQGLFTVSGWYNDYIFILEKNKEDSLVFTYQVYVDEMDGHRQPQKGDSLVIKQYKPFIAADSILFCPTDLVSIEQKETFLFNGFKLKQNYPNPFNPTTIINYELPITNYVELSIFNILGQKVATLVSEKQTAGQYQVNWNASEFSSGLYFYHFQAGQYTVTKKCLLLK